ncbi:35111_t:CDS:2, partial [Racocetra persica]
RFKVDQIIDSTTSTCKSLSTYTQCNTSTIRSLVSITQNGQRFGIQMVKVKLREQHTYQRAICSGLNQGLYGIDDI